MTTCDRPRRAALVAIAIAALARVEPAAAQGTAQDQAAARTLFNESRELIKAGHYEEACVKLEGASRLYAGSGVLLNLADCYEHLGRTASAWTEFGEAASAAERSARPDDLAEATRRQAAIEPRLTRLVIRVAHDVPGLVVERDGTPLDRAVWGEAIPVDPGAHAIVAAAAGYVKWSTSTDVRGEGATTSVDVPALEALPPPPVVTPPVPVAQAPAPPAAEVVTAPPPTAQYWTSRRVASATVAGVGVVAVGVAGVLALVAKANDSSAESETGAQRHADSVSAVNLGNVASVVAVGGAVVAAGGVALWLSAPSAPVRVAASANGVFVWGRF